MAKKLLIDATQPEEIRVAVVHGSRLEEFDSETSTKKQIKGNIYLAKIVRVEPSLQAAFVDFGGNRHGFLPFGEIHPDYYRIPVADRSEVLEEISASLVAAEESQESDLELEGALEEENLNPSTEPLSDLESELDSELDLEATSLNAAESEEIPERRPRFYRYKIQEVIKRRQIILVQVVKEERGNKGAALTTFLSLPGRYCVLMPNAGHRGGGVSRKISDGDDRRRLRDILKEFEVPEGMSLIVRTAGQERNRSEIKRDYEYLLRLWTEIRELTLKSISPYLVYAEGDLIKRSIRDIYGRDIEQVLVEGEEAYKEAKTFMKNLIPSHARRVQLYSDDVPLFHRYQVEEQIDKMMYPTVQLPSGGSIVINPTEALVAIDVNSGKATRERHIDDTALKTNLEAADEIARQMRLRDLAGLVVVDFIDMNENHHIQAVEKRFREATKGDRARIQLGRISHFGLLELSRQRLRPSILEAHTMTCEHCFGTGLVRSVESMALHILRALEKEGIQNSNQEVTIAVPSGVDMYLLNQKRAALVALEARYNMKIQVDRDHELISPNYRMSCIASPLKIVNAPEIVLPKFTEATLQDEIDSTDQEEKITTSDAGEAQRNRRARNRQRKRQRPNAVVESTSVSVDTPAESALVLDVAVEVSEEVSSVENSEKRSRRRRGRRFGKKYDGPRNVDQAQQNSVDAPVVKETTVKEAPVKNNQEKALRPLKLVEDKKSRPSEASKVPANKTNEDAPKKGRKSWIRRLLDT